MKFSAIAFLGVLATGAIAGGQYGDGYKGCKRYEFDPPVCQPYTRELDERDVEERGGPGYGSGGDNYDPAPVCKKKCPPNKLRCSSYGWTQGFPKFKGSFSSSVTCKRSDDYTIVGKIAPGKYGKDYLTITYDCSSWPKDHALSYIGIYQTKSTGVKKLKDLNFNSYCNGNVCVIPLADIPGFPKFCDVDLWVAFDGGRCELPPPPPPPPSYGYGYGYDKKKPAPPPPADVISYAKLSVECYGKKECKSYCCKI